MTPKQFIKQIDDAQEFFNRSTRCLEEKHSTYVPAEGMFTAAQQVAHVAQTVDWFLEGASRPEGFDMDFDAHIDALKKVTSLKEARAWLDKSFEAARQWAKEKSAEEIAQPLPAGPIMGGMPRFVIVGAIDEHTAHHRGALTVYSRMLGLTPPMPYMELEDANA